MLHNNGGGRGRDLVQISTSQKNFTGHNQKFKKNKMCLGKKKIE